MPENVCCLGAVYNRCLTEFLYLFLLFPPPKFAVAPKGHTSLEFGATLKPTIAFNTSLHLSLGISKDRDTDSS